MLTNCAPFTDCVKKINNTQVHNVQDIEEVMQMYNVIEYSNNNSKTSEAHANTIRLNQVQLMALLLVLPLIKV